MEARLNYMFMYTKVILLLVLSASSCKSYVKQSDVAFQNYTMLKLSKKTVGDDKVATLVMCATDESFCRKTLSTVNGKAEFYFLDPAMIHKELEQQRGQKKKQGSKKRWIVLGAAILSIAAGSRAIYRSGFITEKSHLTEIDSKVLTYIREVIHRGGRGRSPEIDKDLGIVAVVAGIVGVIGATGAGIHSFVSNLAADKNWQGHEQKLIDLFVYSKPVLLSKKQADTLLKLLAEYLPAKVYRGMPLSD